MNVPSFPNSSPKKILIVDDEYSIRRGFAMALQSPELFIETEGNATKALARLQAESFGAMILDFKMPGMDGMTMARIMAEREIICPTILVSAMATTDDVLDAVKVGIVDYVGKPVSSEDLRLAVHHVLWRQETFQNLPLAHIAELPIIQRYEAAKYFLQHRDVQIAQQILAELLEQYRDPDSENLLALIAETEKCYDRAEKFYHRGIFC